MQYYYRIFIYFICKKIVQIFASTPIADIMRYYESLSSKAIELRSRTNPTHVSSKSTKKNMYGVVEREITEAEVEIECEVEKRGETKLKLRD